VSLSRGDSTGVEKVIRIRSNATEQLLDSELGCFVDPRPEKPRAHMSRFEKVMNNDTASAESSAARVESGANGFHTTRREWLEAR
jgi:GTP cyclohydrolase FolE2